MREQQIRLEAQTLELVQRIENADSYETVARLIQEFIADLGFHHACFMKVPEHGEDGTKQVLMNSNPEGWVERYIERDYVKRDPMVVELFKTYHPYSWQDVVDRRELDPGDRRIVSEATEFRMNVGFVVPIFGAAGYTGLASISGEHAELPAQARSALQLACLYAHNKLLAMKREREAKLRRLTPRELECLRWAITGKSDWDIGAILHVSEKTVNYHMENVKRKYGVATRVQAIVAAMREGALLPY